MSDGRFYCQVCDRVAPLDSERTFDGARDEWNVHRIDFPERKNDFVQILTCPDCSQLHIDEIFAKYKLRIRNGKDPNFN